VYKPEFCEIAKDTLALGYSMAGVAAECGVCRDTVYAWMKDFPNFSDSIKEGKALGQQRFEKILLAKIGGEDIPGFDPRLCSDTLLLFALKTRFHKDYGNKDKVELATNAPIILNYKIDDED